MLRPIPLFALLMIVLANPLQAEDDEEVSALDCAAGRVFLEGQGGDLATSAHFWIHDCNKLGDSATSAALEARMRQALEDSSLSAFERARLGIRLAQLHVGRKQWDEAASLALAAQAEYLSQQSRDEFITFAFSNVSNALAIERLDQNQPDLAAPHLDARVIFLDLLADSEIYAGDRELMLPLTLTIALGNAWELNDLDRAVVHATHMAKLRASAVLQGEPDRFSNAPLMARVAHDLTKAGRNAEAQTILGSDPVMLALSATFAALDASGPPNEDLDLAVRHLDSVVTSNWWQAGLGQPMGREQELVADTLAGLIGHLRHRGRAADAERLLAAQHPGHGR